MSQATPGFPYLSNYDLNLFVDSCHLCEGKFGLKDCDISFISATNPKPGQQKHGGAIRGSFFEFLARIAKQKYFDSKHCQTMPESVNALFAAIRTKLDPRIAENWQVWRHSTLWTVEVNDILQANLSGLE